MHFPLRIDGVGPEHILYPMGSALAQAGKVFAGSMMTLLDRAIGDSDDARNTPPEPFREVALAVSRGGAA